MADLVEGRYYLVRIPFWDVDGTAAAVIDGKFAPEGFEDDARSHFAPHLVEVIRELSAPEARRGNYRVHYKGPDHVGTKILPNYIDPDDFCDELVALTIWGQLRRGTLPGTTATWAAIYCDGKQTCEWSAMAPEALAA